MVFLHSSKCFPYFLPFVGDLVLPALNPAQGKASGAEEGSPLPRSSSDLCRPFPHVPQSSRFIHSQRFVYSLGSFCLQPAAQERGEEGITSDGWSGGLMRGRLQGFASGASGRKICGWISTSGCSLLQKWPKLHILVITADGITLGVKSCCERMLTLLGGEM